MDLKQQENKIKDLLNDMTKLIDLLTAKSNIIPINTFESNIKIKDLSLLPPIVSIYCINT